MGHKPPLEEKKQNTNHNNANPTRSWQNPHHKIKEGSPQTLAGVTVGTAPPVKVSVFLPLWLGMDGVWLTDWQSSDEELPKG